MKTFVLATLSLCLVNGPCEKKQVEIESRACSFGKVDAKVPSDGVFLDAQISIKCHQGSSTR